MSLTSFCLVQKHFVLIHSTYTEDVHVLSYDYQSQRLTALPNKCKNIVCFKGEIDDMKSGNNINIKCLPIFCVVSSVLLPVKKFFMV